MQYITVKHTVKEASVNITKILNKINNLSKLRNWILTMITWCINSWIQWDDENFFYIVSNSWIKSTCRTLREENSDKSLEILIVWIYLEHIDKSKYRLQVQN